MCWPTSTVISRTSGEKPCALASTEYCAGGRLATSNSPDSFVTVLRTAPVAFARTCTRAPETAAWELSSILPSIVAKLLWAARDSERRDSNTPRRCMVRIVCLVLRAVDNRNVLVTSSQNENDKWGCSVHSFNRVQFGGFPIRQRKGTSQSCSGRVPVKRLSVHDIAALPIGRDGALQFHVAATDPAAVGSLR